MMQLRDYQAQAVEAVLRDYEAVQSSLVTCPTGTGKMLIGAEIIKRRGDEKSIFLAHRDELLQQAKKTIEAHSVLQCEIEAGQSRASPLFPADVLIASVQTMISGRGDARRMHKFSPHSYGLIVIDECHHGVASSYKMVLDYFKENKNLKILGLTATPDRHDEEALGQIFDSVSFDYSTIQAIKDGWLVPIKQQLVDIQSLDFSHIRTTAGDFNGADLAAVMEQERNLYGVCDATIKELGSHRAIMFTTSVKQAEMACDILNRYRAGVARWASGKTPTDQRRAIWRDFTERRYQVFVNCGLVDEGADVPDADLLIQAKPTKSKLKYQQQLGRIMRPLPGIVDGLVSASERVRSISSSSKPVATVMDFTGNAGRHKLTHAIDILGGKITERARSLAERALKTSGRPQRVDELVIEAEQKERDEARRKESEKRGNLTGHATYAFRAIDPFDAFDMVCAPQRAWDAGKSLSLKQRKLLERQGLDPERLSYSQGKQVIQTIFRRWDLGYASLRQCALLKKYGYDTSEMSKDRASALITAIKMNGWTHPGSIRV